MANKKLKTCKSVSKRVKVAANWFSRRKSCKNHRITWKWKTVRDDQGGIMVQWANRKKIEVMMPYV